MHQAGHEEHRRIGKMLHFIMHGVHHDYPNDATRLVMPPIISVPLAIVFYLVFILTLGRFAPEAEHHHGPMGSCRQTHPVGSASRRA